MLSALAVSFYAVCVEWTPVTDGGDWGGRGTYWKLSVNWNLISLVKERKKSRFDRWLKLLRANRAARYRCYHRLDLFQGIGFFALAANNLQHAKICGTESNHSVCTEFRARTGILNDLSAPILPAGLALLLEDAVLLLEGLALLLEGAVLPLALPLEDALLLEDDPDAPPTAPGVPDAAPCVPDAAPCAPPSVPPAAAPVLGDDAP